MLTNNQLFFKHLGQTSEKPLMLEIEKAQGVYMYGPDGRKYMDLISGVAVNNTGHCHPRIVEAVNKQVSTYMHLMVYGEFIQSPQVRYACLLSSILPDNLNNCYFVNSGSEAVEGALKLAKRFTGRSKMISFKNSYHGSTHGALSIQGSEDFKSSFRPLLPDTYQAGFNDYSSLDIIDEKTSCVIIEPIQGEAGVIWPEHGFLEEVRNRCSDTGSLLIFDEIQTAFGRTGHMFAIDRFGVVPDIIVLAKALGGGMPLGAFISSKEIMSVLTTQPNLGHITTFGGHPVSCAAGIASLNVIIEENLVASCRSKGDLFKKYLRHPVISEIRGEGLLLAVALHDPELVRYVIANSPDYGLILDYFLFCRNAFRLAPPLTITDVEISWACTQILQLLEDAQNNINK